ncbi:MAG: hypothetical protein WD042_01475 [Phycisphaeraceae bacterium]
MAVYMFTYHAYRSWMPDNRRGYVRRKKGIQPPDPRMAENYRRRARHAAVHFDDELCESIIDAARGVCRRKNWRCHADVAVWSHFHVVVSWRQFVDARRARTVLRRAITVELRDRQNQRRPWLSRGESTKRVRDRRHLDHLVKTYLPTHRRYGGKQWSEGADAK